MPHAGAVSAIVDLGFTRVEAEVYVFLLEHGPATGYAIAQGLGKAAAGVYKVLDGLSSRGAASVDDSGARQYRAVPHEELLATLERRFDERRDRARETLAGLRPTEHDDRVYRIEDYDAVVDRFRQMCGRASQLVLADVFPDVIEEVRADLEGAADRGIEVMVQVYRPVELRVTRVVVAPEGAEIVAAWRGTWLNADVDAAEHLLAHLDPPSRTVFQAVWSASPYLSIIYHSGLAGEMRARAAERAMVDPSDLAREHAEEVRRIATRRNLKGLAFLRTTWPTSEPPKGEPWS